MSKWGKVKSVLKLGTPLAKPILPGGIGSILDIVNEGLEDSDDPQNEQAIAALAVALDALLNRVERLEQKTGILSPQPD